jgi:hypothetical protein
MTPSFHGGKGLLGYLNTVVQIPFRVLIGVSFDCLIQARPHHFAQCLCELIPLIPSLGKITLHSLGFLPVPPFLRVQQQRAPVGE